MKHKPFLALLAVIALSVSAQVQAPTVTDSLMSIRIDSGSPVTIALFQKTIALGSVSYPQPWEQLGWNKSSIRTITYVFNGKSTTESYAQVTAALVAIANQERANPSQ
jgi:hypothetical protein